MEKGVRLTHTTLRVLRAFLEQPASPLAGSDIWRETGVLSGSLYPILLRLEKAGWLTSEWEQLDPSLEGRPRKRLYRLTGVGSRNAKQALRDVMPAQVGGKLRWNPY
jgi:DNA-binding PadR family transcriptional regulator